MLHSNSVGIRFPYYSLLSPSKRRFEGYRCCVYLRPMQINKDLLNTISTRFKLRIEVLVLSREWGNGL